MGRTRRTVIRAVVLVTALATVLSAGTAAPSLAQTDVCGVLTVQELAGVLGVTPGEGTGYTGICSWQASLPSGEQISVGVYADLGTFADLRSQVQGQATGLEELTVAGRPALRGTEELDSGAKTGAVAVDQGDHASMLSVQTADATFDVLAAATSLMEIAAERLANVVVEAPSEPPATHPDACGLFTDDELSTIMAEPLTGSGDSRSCTWSVGADSSSLRSVAVSFDSGGLTVLRSLMSGGQDITVAGQPAYQYGFEMGDTVISAVAVDLGADTISITVTSDDKAVDAAAVAVQLMEQAFSQGLTVGPEPSTLPSPCALLSPEEVAAAIGSKAKLKAQDLETSCILSGGEGDSEIQVMISNLEAATLDMAASAIGATEVEGIGERAWWSGDYSTLYSRQGERAYMVTITPGTELKEARLQKMATAVMATLLSKG